MARPRPEHGVSRVKHVKRVLLLLLAAGQWVVPAAGGGLTPADVTARWAQRLHFWRLTDVAWPLDEAAVYLAPAAADDCHCRNQCLADDRCVAVDYRLTDTGPLCRLASRRGNATGAPADGSAVFTAVRAGLAAFGEHCLSDGECGWDVVAGRCLAGVCACSGERLGDQCVVSDCHQLMASPAGVAPSGEYWVQLAPGETPLALFCDMETDGGGWTVFQRRQNDTEQLDFYRDWQQYRDGFGNVTGQFWLGNELLHRLTARRPQQLRIDLFSFEDEHRFAQYQSVTLAGEDDFYRIQVSTYSGNAGGSFGSCNGKQFSTKDADHDTHSAGSCANMYRGGWWYSACHGSNLNGLYLWGPTELYARGVVFSGWLGYYYSLKHTEMKIRPTDVSTSTM
ncbi:Ficolin-1 [Amphibalanus amphitrite]|uniref:Ficolin-1 n=1 Tax=Amphibalanus amphitrite TaxID=1232801 RepID=A0A6A4VK87_AMPAM|nr:Ficolin-1 [Amphibalanus amphitrite]